VPSKLACLAADGKLSEGDIWRLESLIGSIFEGSVRIVEGRIRPRVRGTAYVNAESTLLFDAADPFAMGIRP
jgi:4-hydroxyproline epimerase